MIYLVYIFIIIGLHFYFKWVFLFGPAISTIIKQNIIVPLKPQFFIFPYEEQLTDTQLPPSPTFYLGNCPYGSHRGFHLFSYFTFISWEQTVLFDPWQRMVLAGILQGMAIGKTALSWGIAHLFSHILSFYHPIVVW